MNRTKIAALTLLAGTLAGVASAQSINIEVNSTSTTVGVPSVIFAGAAAEPGSWNIVHSGSNSYTLRDRFGNNTPATLTVSGQGVITTSPTPGLSSNLALLMNDFHRASTGQITYEINNLQYGRYAIYTYAAHPNDAANRAQVKVYADGWQNTQVVGGALSGVQVDPENLYSVHVVNLQLSNSMTIRVEPFTGAAVCAGIQIKKLPDDQPRMRIYVNDNAEGEPLGFSWVGALRDLQIALRTAKMAGGEKCEIWVAQGIYKPTTGTDRGATFRVPSGLKLYGGFAANETTLAQRTFPEFYITNLSGAIGTSAQNDNSYTVVTVENASNQTLIDGFTISRGSNDVLGIDANGGGVRVINSSPTFRKTKFISNYATIDGAGVYVKSGEARFAECLFYTNTTGLGAGAALASTGNATVVAHNTRFQRNDAASHGGALNIGGGARFVNCLFSGNTAVNNGGAALVSATSGVREFINCTFAGNTSGGTSGAVHMMNSVQMAVRNTIMWDNADTAAAPSVGGATGQLAVERSTLQGFFFPIGSTNSNADPMFANPRGANNVYGDFDDDFRLRRGSPAIDSGENAFLVADIFDLNSNNNTSETVPVDLNGVARAVRTPYAPAGVHPSPVDMGAFEHQPTCAADLNGDGVVNFADLNIVLSNFGDAFPPADTNADGVVNFADLNAVLTAFGANCPAN
ncbi:MAG: hypothetical protein KF684_07360 [Phycisphaeraceae bacterium]|nr:hypothetical protein [Phycisphaeraceae bacterium]